MKSTAAFLGFIAAIGIASGMAWAHQVDRAEQATEVHLETGQVENLYMISAEDLAHEQGHVVHGQRPSPTLLEELEEEFADYFDEHTAVRADGERCKLEEREFVAYPAPDERLHYYQFWQCPTEVHEIELENRIMHDHHHGGYRHIAQVKVGDDIYPTVFEPQFPSYTVYPEFIDGDGDVVVVTADGKEEVDGDAGEATEAGDDDQGGEDDEQDDDGGDDGGDDNDELLMVLAALVGLGLVGLVGFLERR